MTAPNPDRLQLAVPGADPAAARRPCGCRAEAGGLEQVGHGPRSRGAHQAGCPLRRRVCRRFRRASHARLSATARELHHVLGVDGAEALAVLRVDAPSYHEALARWPDETRSPRLEAHRLECLSFLRGQAEDRA